MRCLVGGDAGDYFTSFGAAVMGNALLQDPVFEAAEPIAYRISSEVCAQGTDILVDAYSDITSNNRGNQVVPGNGTTINIVTGGINSRGVKSNSKRVASKTKPLSGMVGGHLNSIVSNVLYLLR